MTWHRCDKGVADGFAFNCDVCRAYQAWVAKGRPDPWAHLFDGPKLPQPKKKREITLPWQQTIRL